ncbi:hypothetical protein ABGF48_02135 [Helcococcus bovis]|uniref:hypothetical protein n=2 Tax=Helcococcus bovis TaxID=3153252 RepID=UPI0038BDE6FD
MIKYLKKITIKNIIFFVILYFSTYVLAKGLNFIFSTIDITLVYKNIIIIYIFSLLNSIFFIKVVYKEFNILKIFGASIFITIALLLFSYTGALLTSLIFSDNKKDFVKFLNDAIFISRVFFSFLVIDYIIENLNKD